MARGSSIVEEEQLLRLHEVRDVALVVDASHLEPGALALTATAGNEKERRCLS